MRASIVVFPGSNCDRDMKVALEQSGAEVSMVWHGDSELPESDLVVLPGGFSYGDYLRSGAMAAHSPIMREVKKHADEGGYVLGVCNGFQVLCETHLLPGVLMRNRHLKFMCRDVPLAVEGSESIFTGGFYKNQVVTFPIAHHDGNYRIDDDGLKALQDNGQIAFTYTDGNGVANDNANPNGSVRNIAGIFNKRKTILGMMPHPERLIEPALGGEDGKKFFDSLVAALG